MMVSNRGSFVRVLIWQWKYCLIFLVAGAVAYATHEVGGWRHLQLPAAPAGIIGAALGIFASFRANAAYARWWEGRQLWGKITNVTRLFCSQVMCHIGDSSRQRRVLLQQLLWVHVLRVQLRDDPVDADAAVLRLADLLAIPQEERQFWRTQSSLCHATLHNALLDLAAEPGLTPQALQSLEQSIGGMLDAQGGCERIKRTPMPRGYGFFVERLLVLFSCLFPFSIVDQIGWVVVPINLVVCLGFLLISETGRVLEDPFTHFWNSLPVLQMSTNLERNVRQRLGDNDLPAPIAVDTNGILW
jgi:putative membrane protein